METLRNKKWLRLHFLIPEEMINLFYKAGLLALLDSPIPFPCECIVALNSSSASQLRGQRRYCTELPY